MYQHFIQKHQVLYTGSCSRPPIPPSICSSEPVMNRDDGDPRKAMNSPISVGLQIRPTGCMLDSSLNFSGLPSNPASSIGVAVAAGRIALTRTPYSPSSTASARESETSALSSGGSAKKAIDAVLGAGAVPVVVMAIADREDPDAAPFRQEHKLECLVTLSEIRAS